MSSAGSSGELNGHCSVFDSDEPKPEDELVHLRMVSNQQKVRMHELKMENKALEEQNNFLRYFPVHFFTEVPLGKRLTKPTKPQQVVF